MHNIYILIATGIHMFMWPFNTKTQENVDITLLERVKQLEAKIARLDGEVLDVITSIDTIRNKVLRKIQFKKEDLDTSESKDLYNGMLIPENHGAKR